MLVRTDAKGGQGHGLASSAVQKQVKINDDKINKRHLFRSTYVINALVLCRGSLLGLLLSYGSQQSRQMLSIVVLILNMKMWQIR